MHVHFAGHLPRRAETALSAAARAGCPLVVTFQDHRHPDLPPLSATAHRRVARLIARARRVTAVSAELARQIARDYGPVAGRVAIVGNGVGPEWFSGKRREGASVVAMARLAPYKGIDLLIWAFADLAARRPEARLEIIGPDFQRGHYQRLAARLRLGASVRFHGALRGDEARALLSKARLFVSASRHETYGIAILEAMAARVPVLATRTGVGRELRHGRDAWLVPTGDARALARALVRLWEDAALRRRLAQGARRYAAAKTWERRAREYSELYREC